MMTPADIRAFMRCAHGSTINRLREQFPSIDQAERHKAWRFAVRLMCLAETAVTPEASGNCAAAAQQIFEREGYPQKTGWIQREKARQMPGVILERNELLRFRKADDSPGLKEARLRQIRYCMIMASNDFDETEDIAFALVMANGQQPNAL